MLTQTFKKDKEIYIGKVMYKYTNILTNNAMTV